MKKFILSIAALTLSMGAVFAQDLAQATESYNNGAAALSAGNKTNALDCFKSALSMAEALGDEGAEVVSNCKGVIPDLLLSITKDLIKAGEFDKAFESLKETQETAANYGATDIVNEATALIPTAYIQKGSALLKAKDAAGAAVAFQAALEADPSNGNAALRLGQALAATGKTAEAIEAYTKAAENGQAAVANKQIGTIYLKSAVKALQAKDFKTAIEAAESSVKFNETPNAYKIAGTAYTNLGNKEAAVKNLSKYLELSPSAADAAQIKAAIEALKK